MFASNYFENKMLNLMRGQAITAPATLYLGLFLSNPGDTGTEGTEISYTGYARQPITFSAPAQSGNSLIIQNAEQINFAEAGSNVGNVTYVAVFDALNGGNMLLYASLETALNVQAGVTPVFRIGNIKWMWGGHLSTYYKTAIMNTLRGVSLPGFTPYAGFCNGDPTDTGSEVSGNNYARAELVMSVPEQQASGTALTSNTEQASTPQSTGNWGNITHTAIFDAQSNGNPYIVIPLGTTYTVVAGSACGFKAGGLKININ